MKTVKIFAITSLLLSVSVTASFAQFSAGADIVSRYLWRGWDFGNSAAVQPALAFTAPAGNGSFEIGAWGSFGVSGGLFGEDAFNENDLYVSYSNGPISVIFTDYFFPSYSGNDGFFDFSSDSTTHLLELGAAVGNEIFSASGYYTFYTPKQLDIEKSWYFEVGVTPPYEVEDIGLSLFIGGGNGFYDFIEGDESTKFVITNIGITVSKGMFATTWVLNPDQETTHLVFMVSL